MKAAVWVLLLVGFNYRVRERCCCRRHLGFYFFLNFISFYHFFGAVRTTKSFVIHRCCSGISAQISEMVIFSSKLARVKLEACEKQLFRWPTRVQFSNFFGLAYSFFFPFFFFSHTSSHPSLSTRTSFCWSLVALSECNLVLGGSCRLKSDLLMTL